MDKFWLVRVNCDFKVPLKVLLHNATKNKNKNNALHSLMGFQNVRRIIWKILLTKSHP